MATTNARWRPVFAPVVVSHAAAFLLFAVVALIQTWPLPVLMGTHLPGTGADDNLVFLWNFWWMRQALADPLKEFFSTSYLFHPGGVDLSLHTHTALNAFAGATLFGRAPLPVALNLTLVASCALNGFSAYLLARQTSARGGGLAHAKGVEQTPVTAWLPAVTAGLFFAASPPLVSHLYGHFNLYTAWVLVLFVLALIAAFDRRSWLRVAVAGGLLAAVAYTDYYYLVYACAFLACVLAYRLMSPVVRLTPSRVAPSRLDVALLLVASCAAAAAGLIWWTGGLVVTIAGLDISLTTGRNLRALTCVLALWWIWRRRRPHIGGRIVWARIGGDAQVVGGVCATAALLMAPLLLAAVDLWRGGHYVSQTYLWRSAPAGADLGTLALGNPFNGMWGPWVMQVYGTLGMNAFAGPLWLGVVPLVLILTRRTWCTTSAETTRLWLIVMAVFGVWALGPYLFVLGVDTGLPLPQLLLRFVPIVSNARIPGHAAIFVSLAMAVLLAAAVASSRSRWGTGLLIGVILVDFWTAPFPVAQLDAPAIYERLARLPDGAVLELPLGIRDGFGVEGRFDPAVLYHQSIHGKPMVGGYISRVSPIVKARFHDSPVLATLLHLSAGEPMAPGLMPDPAAARDALRGLGVEYIVIDDRTTDARLVDYLMRLPVRLISEDATRRLFVWE